MTGLSPSNALNSEPSRAQRVRLITAIGTPLRGDDDALHVEGLATQIEDQAAAGIDGLLAAGTMGAMQQLPDTTWQELVRVTAAEARDRCEVLVGVTDQSLSRVIERVAFVETVAGVDGVVALTPSWGGVTPSEQVAFYRALSDRSKLPVYIYELQPVTGVTLPLPDIVELAGHANLKGIKLSAGIGRARQLFDLVPDDFRIIPAQPDMLDVCAIGGPWKEHLDGIFAAAPFWAMGIVDHVARGETAAAAKLQSRLNDVLRSLTTSGHVMAGFTALMNARGIPGRFHASPLQDLGEADRERLLMRASVAELLRTDAGVGAVS